MLCVQIQTASNERHGPQCKMSVKVSAQIRQHSKTPKFWDTLTCFECGRICTNFFTIVTTRRGNFHIRKSKFLHKCINVQEMLDVPATLGVNKATTAQEVRQTSLHDAVACWHHQTWSSMHG